MREQQILREGRCVHCKGKISKDNPSAGPLCKTCDDEFEEPAFRKPLVTKELVQEFHTDSELKQIMEIEHLEKMYNVTESEDDLIALQKAKRVLEKIRYEQNLHREDLNEN